PAENSFRTWFGHIKRSGPGTVPAENSFRTWFGHIKRSGPWTVPAENSFRTWFGHIKLDLRQAQISASETHIHARALFGNVDLLVPEGVEVEVRARTQVGRTN